MKSIIIFSILLASYGCFGQSLNYDEEEICFDSDSLTLCGTFSIPDTSDFPVLIMITGGGNRNRNARYNGFEPYKLIAEYLAPRGVGVLRYDDRGIGKSTGPRSLYATLDDFSNDALAAVSYLKTRKDLRISSIGLFGHCAGATAAIRAAEMSDDISFLITMAACAMDGENTLLNETRSMLENQGRSEEDIIELQALRSRLFKVIRTNEGWPEITEDIRVFIQKRYDNLSPEYKSSYPEFEDFYKRSYDKAYISYGKYPYIKSFINIDPIPSYSNFKNPLLALYGEDDLNVAPKYHIEPLSAALNIAGNTNYQVSIIKDANHYFVTDWKSKKFATDFLPTIAAWIETIIK